MSTSAASQAAELSTDGMAYAGQVMLVLLFIIGLILVCAWLFRKLSGQFHSVQGHLKVVGSVGVGSRERVVIVAAGDTWLVLGVANGSVTKLHEMPPQAPPDAPSGDFKSRLNQAFRQQAFGKKSASDTTGDPQ